MLGAAEAFRYPTVLDYRQALQRVPGAVNLALLTGHSSLRLDSMPGRLDQAADATAQKLMQDKLRLALQQGSIGLSTGLDYPPAQAAPTAEVVELAAVLREFGAAVYVTHMRRSLEVRSYISIHIVYIYMAVCRCSYPCFPHAYV